MSISGSVQRQTDCSLVVELNPPHDSGTTEGARLRAAGLNRRTVNFTETLNSLELWLLFRKQPDLFHLSSPPPPLNCLRVALHLFSPRRQSVYTYFKTIVFLGVQK